MTRYIRRKVERPGGITEEELIPVGQWEQRVASGLADLVHTMGIASVTLNHTDGTSVTYSREKQ